MLKRYFICNIKNNFSINIVLILTLTIRILIIFFLNTFYFNKFPIYIIDLFFQMISSINIYFRKIPIDA